MKWRVTVLVGASVNVEVEADTEEEAKAKALDEAETPNLCFQCGDQVDVTDPYESFAAYPIISKETDNETTE